jgi:hypothetical protein
MSLVLVLLLVGAVWLLVSALGVCLLVAAARADAASDALAHAQPIDAAPSARFMRAERRRPAGELAGPRSRS